MFSIIIDPARTGGAERWRGEVQAFVDFVRASPAAPGSEGVQLAGEPERRCRAVRSRDGIPVDAATWAEIVAAGELVDVSASQANAAANATY